MLNYLYAKKKTKKNTFVTTSYFCIISILNNCCIIDF